MVVAIYTSMIHLDFPTQIVDVARIRIKSLIHTEPHEVTIHTLRVVAKDIRTIARTAILRIVPIGIVCPRRGCSTHQQHHHHDELPPEDCF